MSAIDRPGKIVCVGRNYAAHAAEMGNTVPKEPVLFLKPPSAVIGDGDTILLPAASNQVEHEGEIGVVIARTLKNAERDEALAGIGGLTCLNDVSARDFQRSDAQWTRAKGFDTFCPVGPRVVPLSELDDLASLEVVCRVNGETRQHGHACDMVFDIPTILAYISAIMTLEPGDLVATGSPSGVGPLTPGDTVEIEIGGIGVLSNPVANA
jgi:2-keto-4-pentenoate hydratase/2-oxohepta-3-ene-1,7-dioic acid hydratase in catechol pathway